MARGQGDARAHASVEDRVPLTPFAGRLEPSDMGSGPWELRELRGRREELQLMAVEILEVEGRARYPAVGDRASGRHATFAENSGSPFELRLVHREGEVVARELTVVLLKMAVPSSRGRRRDGRASRARQ